MPPAQLACVVDRILMNLSGLRVLIDEIDDAARAGGQPSRVSLRRGDAGRERIAQGVRRCAVAVRAREIRGGCRVAEAPHRCFTDAGELHRRPVEAVAAADDFACSTATTQTRRAAPRR